MDEVMAAGAMAGSTLHPRFPDTGDLLGQTSQTLDHTLRNTPFNILLNGAPTTVLGHYGVDSQVYDKHVTRAFQMELTTAHQECSALLIIQTLQYREQMLPFAHLGKRQKPLVEVYHCQ